jgi:hypothetical protein
MMIIECGAGGGPRSYRGNQGTRRVAVALLLHLPQIPQELTWDKICPVPVVSQVLTV